MAGMICMNRIFNFSGIYEQQPDLIREMRTKSGFLITDLTRMEGVNGYCSAEAEQELEAQIRAGAQTCAGAPEASSGGIRFLDNGNYHYLSCPGLRTVPEPFDLIVFDHHTDMQEPGLIPCLSCGSWVLESLKDRECGKNLLRRAVLVGPPSESLREEDKWEGLTLISEPDANTADRTLAMISETLHPEDKDPELPVYLSIDKDVLSDTEIRLNWDQGSMTFRTLKKILQGIVGKYRVCGLDICGEPYYNQFPDENIRMSEMINLELLRMVSDEASADDDQE